MTTVLVVLAVKLLWRKLLFWLHGFLNWALLYLLNHLLELESTLLRLKLMFCPPRWSLLCEGPFEKGLLVRCCWKTLNRNSLDCSCAFTVSVVWSRKPLPNNSFPEFSNNALLSFIIDLAWLELFMAPASALSHLWYDIVLLVCPTKSTVCWTE